MTDQTLGRSPLIEAIVGFRLATPLTDEQLEMLGSVLHRRLGGPTRPHHQIEVKLPSATGEAPELIDLGPVATTTFGANSQPDSDGSTEPNRAVTIAKGEVAAHFIGVYPGWETLRSEVDDLAASIRPFLENGIAVVHVRYINRIDVPAEGAVDLSQYVYLLPAVPIHLHAQLRSMTFSVDTAATDPYAGATLAIRVIPGTDGGIQIQMDIVVEKSSPKPADWSEAWGLVEEAHQQQKDIFYGIITDKLRDLCQQ
jgi:uncharacterized protein (TIGR04255 family)